MLVWSLLSFLLSPSLVSGCILVRFLLFLFVFISYYWTMSSQGARYSVVFSSLAGEGACLAFDVFAFVSLQSGLSGRVLPASPRAQLYAFFLLGAYVFIVLTPLRVYCKCFVGSAVHTFWHASIGLPSSTQRFKLRTICNRSCKWQWPTLGTRPMPNGKWISDRPPPTAQHPLTSPPRLRLLPPRPPPTPIHPPVWLPQPPFLSLPWPWPPLRHQPLPPHPLPLLHRALPPWTSHRPLPLPRRSSSRNSMSRMR